MTDTIREQIISAVLTAAAGITTAAGYNVGMGNKVFRSTKLVEEDEMPAVVVWPQAETGERKVAGVVQHAMTLKLEGLALYGSLDINEVAESMLGDLIEFMTAPTFTMAYTSGSAEIEVGDTITGATSGKTAYVTGVALSSGTWAGGDAAGSLTLRRKSGDFTAENLNVGASLNVATTTGTVTVVTAITRVTGGLARDIAYTGGGTYDAVDESETSAGVYAEFDIVYETAVGNPY